MCCYALNVLSNKDNIVIVVLCILIAMAFSSKLNLIVAYKLEQTPHGSIYSSNSAPIECNRTNTK